MKSSVFSVIIPTYNRGDRIANSIQSILNQSYSNFEIIIVDDGSIDKTREVVEGFDDDRIKNFHKKNEERAIARNYGIKQAKGEYITFLDSDDQLYSHFLDEAKQVIEESENPEWFHLAYEIKDEKGNVLRRENSRVGNINRSLITGNHLSCIGVFVRKDIMLKYQFNEDPDIIGSEDYLLWLELAGRYPLRYSNKVSAFMIQHSGRSVVNFNKHQLIRRIQKSISFASTNPSISDLFGSKLNIFKAHRYLYLANHLSRATYKSTSFKYYFLSVINLPGILLHRNSFSYLKSLFLFKNYFSYYRIHYTNHQKTNIKILGLL